MKQWTERNWSQWPGPGKFQWEFRRVQRDAEHVPQEGWDAGYPVFYLEYCEFVIYGERTNLPGNWSRYHEELGWTDCSPFTEDEEAEIALWMTTDNGLSVYVGQDPTYHPMMQWTYEPDISQEPVYYMAIKFYSMVSVFQTDSLFLSLR